jgi:hypothetical protein
MKIFVKSSHRRDIGLSLIKNCKTKSIYHCSFRRVHAQRDLSMHGQSFLRGINFNGKRYIFFGVMKDGCIPKIKEVIIGWCQKRFFQKLISHLENIHPIQTKDCDLQASASLYEETISDFFKLKKDEFPVFDLILLGIGQDGHTSSLFPGNPSLLVKDRLVVDVISKGIPEKRITLTLPAINHADMIFFLVSGQEKQI